MSKKVTLVTGLWDIKRDTLEAGWNRSFEDHYITKFKELLNVPCNLIIFGEEELKEVVFKIRSEENTQFIVRNQDWFKNEFYEKIQSIRTSEEWKSLAPWLPESTQGKLEMYNPLVMSKMFLLNDARIFDKFESEHLYWIDAALSTTVSMGYFTSDNVLDKLLDKISKFLFICFPYEANTEIHGFAYPEINTYTRGKDIKMVARGGFFGGPVDTIGEINAKYYDLMSTTLNEGYMGTEESLFSLLTYQFPNKVCYSKIEENGLLYYFFEKLKNDEVVIESVLSKNAINRLDYRKVALYVITYNSPDQFNTLCKSFEQYDKDYLDLPNRKILLNNSIDRSTDKEYDKLCEKWGFEQIKKDNIGICGGRQFIAEHFDEQEDLEHYLFYEDDMFFYNGNETTCKNGFLRKVSGLYKKSLEICNVENLDYLKLNVTEFFGDNLKQWAWHNVPSDKRKEYFPDHPVKNNHTFDFPNTVFSSIKSHKGLPYALGEIYYCNWPQVITREGSKKMFLDTKWANPFEQTWMSHIFQLTKEEVVRNGILLLTPTEHDRFDHYPKEERREN
jgi:hypothetical protein